MIQLRVYLLMVLMLLPASHLMGQGKPNDVGLDNTPVICNDGTIPVSVARAFRRVNAQFFQADQWEIQGWYSVGPGTCGKIGPEEHYQNDGLLSFEHVSVTLLAFAFTDSTGVWGAARVRDTTDGVFKPSNQKLCVQDGPFRVVRDASKGEDPAARDCGRGELAGYYQTPASLVFSGDTYGGTYGDAITGPHSRDYLHVRLGSNERAIPLGKQTSSGGAAQAQGPGTTGDLEPVLADTIRGPGAPMLRGSLSGGRVEVCIPVAVVQKQSWADPQSARAKALKDAIRQFTGSHTFGGGGKARFRVGETLDGFMVEEVKACSDHDDEFNMFMQSPQAAPPPATPRPVANDDPFGPGGFITPPTATTVQLCVPADLVPSWENPSADPEMEAFRLLLAHYTLDQGKAGEVFRVRNNAFVNFERARRAASPSTPLPGSLVDAVRAGQSCPATDHLYNIHQPTPAPQK